MVLNYDAKQYRWNNNNKYLMLNSDNICYNKNNENCGKKYYK